MASESTTGNSASTTTQAAAPSTTNTGKGLLLKAELIAQQYREEVLSSLSQSLAPKGRASPPPKLVGILGTSSAPSRNYAEFTRRQCEELGFGFVLRETGAGLRGGGGGEGEGVEEAIIEANEDEGVHGIMVYYPIFGGRQVSFLFLGFLFRCR